MTARASAGWSSVLSLYAVSLLAGGACLWAIARSGQSLFGATEPSTVIGQAQPLLQAMLEQLRTNFGSPLGSLIFQILAVLSIARLCGIAFRRLGQPQVVGEILAGILLGPSFFKVLLPAAHAYLFPDNSLRACFFSAISALCCSCSPSDWNSI